MTHKLQVKEHLRNSALYRPLSEPSLDGEWKCRLFYRRTVHSQLKVVLRKRSRLPKPFICIGVPILYIAFSFAIYFGLIHPEHWYENIIPIANFDIPPIGLKETLIFVAIVNGLTFLVRKRAVS